MEGWVEVSFSSTVGLQSDYNSGVVKHSQMRSNMVLGEGMVVLLTLGGVARLRAPTLDRSMHILLFHYCCYCYCYCYYYYHYDDHYYYFSYKLILYCTILYYTMLRRDIA